MKRKIFVFCTILKDILRLLLGVYFCMTKIKGKKRYKRSHIVFYNIRPLSSAAARMQISAHVDNTDTCIMLYMWVKVRAKCKPMGIDF